MARKCELTDKKPIKINRVSIERSRITKRFKRTANVNLLNKYLNSEVFGNMQLRIASNTLRTIHKYENFDQFLVGVKRKNLSKKAKKMRKVLWNKIQVPSNI